MDTKTDNKKPETRNKMPDSLLVLPDTPIPAGFPSPAHEALSDSLNINEYLVKDFSSTMLFKVRGDSMKDAGLLDGDIVFVTFGVEAKPNDIVIADVDNERTIKFLRFDKDVPYLEAANKNYKPIRPKDSLTIVGVVTAMCRRYFK